MLTVKVIWCGFRLTVLTLALASMGTAPSGANPQERDPQPILASELDINRYSTDASDLADLLSQTSQGMEQITSVSELSDVNPDDWAYQALQGLVERYGCIVGYPNLTFKGDRPLSRWEFAAGLNACMGAMERLLQENVAVLSQDVEQLKRLTQAFEVELVSLKGRLDNTETRLSFLEDHNFSATSKIFGNLIVQGNAYFSGEGENSSPQVTAQYNLFLANVTSFTGKDTLLTGFATTNTTLADVAVVNDDRLIGPTREGTTYAASAGDLNNSLRIITLQYQFPVYEDLFVTLVPVNRYNFNSTLLPNFVPDYGLGLGPVSAFATAPPVYYIGGGTGGAISYNFIDNGVFSLTYLTPTGSLPVEGGGLFNGDYIASAQLNYNPTPQLFLQAFYQHGYFAPGNFAFNNGQTFNPGSGFVGTGLANTFDDAGILFDEASAVSSNAYGLGGYYHVAPQFAIGGWVNMIKARLLGKGDADIWSYSLQAIFPDLFKEGNLGGVVVGVEPTLTGLSTSLGRENFKNDFSLHLETFYRYQLNNRLSLTPYLMWITAPNQDASNQDLVIGGIRTNISF
jgi:hypothetical protein